MEDPTTRHEHVPSDEPQTANTQPPDPVIPVDRTVTLLLDPDGHLRHVVRGGTQDDELALTPGTSVVELAPEPAAGAKWNARLATLRADPFTTLAFDLDSPGLAPGGGVVRRLVTAIPVPGELGGLASIVVRFGIARVEGGMPDPDEERFRFLAETVPHMLWMGRLDGTVEYVSPSWVAFTGLTYDELMTEGYYSAVHPDDVSLMTPVLDASGQYRLPHFRLRRHDGEFRWVEVNLNTVRSPSGEVLRVVGSTTDITERILADQRRSALTEQLEAAASVAQLGRFETNHRTGAIHVDSRFVEILGLVAAPTTRAELLENFPTIHPDDRQPVADAYQTLSAGTVSEIELEFRIQRRTASRSTEERWISVRGRRQTEGQEFIGTVGVVGDVTARRAENTAMLRAQKREALGTLAGGIAHDFNNVISAILSNAAVAETEIAAGQSPATSLAEIRRGAERAGDVVRRLLGFSRESEIRKELFDVTAVAREACELLRPTLAPGVVLHAPGGTASPTLGSSSELHQVAVNLIGNAGDAAADGGGTVTVEVDEVDLKGITAATASDDPITQLPLGRYVRLRVADDGPGIPTEVLPRIFDPFFTTKEPGKGTGLGLAAAQSIVRGQGGEISVASLPSQRGTVFTVVLPIAAEEPAPTPAGLDAVASPASNATPHILFVDDEETLANLAARAFPLLGCTVDTFTDPGAAVVALRRDPRAFDAVITDLAMPGMNGLEVAAAVVAVRPDLPVILSSGYVTAENREAAFEVGVREVIPKPCSLGDLASAIGRVTSKQSARS